MSDLRERTPTAAPAAEYYFVVEIEDGEAMDAAAFADFLSKLNLAATRYFRQTGIQGVTLQLDLVEEGSRKLIMKWLVTFGVAWAPIDAGFTIYDRIAGDPPVCRSADTLKEAGKGKNIYMKAAPKEKDANHRPSEFDEGFLVQVRFQGIEYRF
jgi:hypothetical protein